MVIFKRELKTGDTLQGSDIKDTAVASQFGDIYDGQITFLPKFERTADNNNLTIGEVPVGNTYASGDYIIETPIKRKPPFGAGILKGLDVNLYHDNLNYNLEQALPDIEVYKFNRTIGNLVQGNFGRPRTENVIVGSTNYTKTALISELFDGADPFSPGGKENIEYTGDFFMYAHDAYRLQTKEGGLTLGSDYFGCIPAIDLKEFKDRYCHKENAGDSTNTICRLQTYWAGGGSPRHWCQPTKGQKLRRVDPTWDRYCIDYKFCKDNDRMDDFARNYVHYGTEPTSTVWDLSSRVTPDNSIFSRVHTQGDIIDIENRDEQGNPAYLNWGKAIFSNSSHSGSCMLLSTAFDSSEDDLSIKSTSQIACAYFRLPKPLELIREHSEAAAVNALEVDIKFNIEQMTKMHKSNDSRSGGAHDATMTPQGLNMFRSFIIMTATRPPDATEMKDFGKYIRALNGPSNCTHAIGNYGTYHYSDGALFPTSLTTDKKNPVSDENKNHYNGICMMKWQDPTDKDNDPLASNGGFYAVNWSNSNTGGVQRKRRGGWGASSGWKETRGVPNAGNTRYCPWVPKKGCESYADDTMTNGSVPEDNFHTPLANAVSDTEVPFLEKNWYTWKMIINNKSSSGTDDLDQGGKGEGDITWILLDNDNKIVTKRKQKHVGYRSAIGNAGADLAPGGSGAGKYGDMPTDMTNEKSGFPAYVSIWLLNMAKGGWGELHSGESPSLWTPGPVSTTSSIFIDSIKISGFEGSTSNVTLGPRNSARGTMSIASSTEEFIDTDGTFTATESPPVLSTPVPSYISWGTNTDIFAEGSTKNNVFMGDFTTDNPLFNDYTDNDKTMNVLDRADGSGALSVDNINSDIILRIPNTNATGQKKFGYWISSGANTNLHGDTGGAGSGPNFNNALLLDSTAVGVNYVDDLTKKGFFTIDFANSTNPANYNRRENPLFSTKILEVLNASTGKIRVANSAVLNGFYDDEFIIYRAGYDWAASNTHARSGLKVISTSTLSDTIQLNYSIVLADDDSTPLSPKNDNYLHELYISPYRFWFALEIFNVSKADDTPLPGKGYSFSVIQSPDESDSPMPHEAGNIFGMTYNESLYSDTSSLSNKWKLYQSTTGALVETGVDYGFGSASGEAAITVDDELGTGYIRKYVPEKGYNAIHLDGLIDVESGRLDKPDEKISLYIKSSDETKGSCAIRSTKYVPEQGDTTNSDPYFTFYYLDEKPTIENFLVKPNEGDPFYPTFTWDTQDDDLWYGFLLLSNNEIKHQYDGAVAHIPLNETAIDKTKIFLYRYDGTQGGTSVAATFAGGTSKAESTAEGLAGNALKCVSGHPLNGQPPVSWADASYTQPAGEFSLVAHFTCDSIATTRYIIDKKDEFSIYIDTSGNVNATLEPASGTTVTLKSTTVINTDGETPMNIILTFDGGLGTGNVKLFVNGKLEDQSGLKTTDGSVNNWKIGQNMDNNSAANSQSELFIGAQNQSTSTVRIAGLYHSGTIEEITIYNKAIYPVVPQTGELTVYKPLFEFTLSSIQAGISNVARLFVKDYHNIRGTLANDVAASSMVSYRKSGLGLSYD